MGGGYGRVHGRIMVTRTFQTKRDIRYIICRNFSRRWFLARNFLAYVKIKKHSTQKNPSLPQGVCSGLMAVAIDDSPVAAPKRHVPVVDVLDDGSMALGGHHWSCLPFSGANE